MRLIVTMLTVLASATVTSAAGWRWRQRDDSGASEDEFTIASLIAEGR